MSHADGDARQLSNRILSLLPAEEYERLAPHFRYVELRAGDVLYQPEGAMPYVYFPLSGMLSVTAPMRDGREVEVGVVGREGMAGMPVFLGTDSAPFRVVAQIPGGAVRVGAGAFLGESGRGGGLHRLLLRYAQAFFVQAAQTAACNRLHSVGERLAKWLLTSCDRARSDELEITQEFLAVMLGVRRAGVSEAVAALEGKGLVGHVRRRVTVVDGPGLEAASCECYGVVRREFDRLLAPPLAPPLASRLGDAFLTAP